MDNTANAIRPPPIESLIHDVAGIMSPIFSTLIAIRTGRDWESVKGYVGSLTSEATIATFLAAVQAQLITLSYQDNSTSLKVAINSLGFAALLMDVITAWLAILASTVIQRHVAIVEGELAAIENATAEQLADLTPNFSRGLFPTPYMFDIERRMLEKLDARLAELHRSGPSGEGNNSIQVNPQTEIPRRRSQRPPVVISAVTASLMRIRFALSIGDSASSTMMYGVLCFFASVVCLAVSTQPPPVWIVSAVVCSLVITLPLGNQILELTVGIRVPSIFEL